MKSKPITILMVTFILVLGICFFLIRPVVVSIWSSYRNFEQSKKDLQNIEEKKEILQALQNNPNLTNVGEIALKYIPQEQDSGDLVVEISAVAAANNLQIDEISMEKNPESTPSPEESQKTSPKPQSSPTKKSDINEVNFGLKVSGSYDNLINFLRGLESGSRLISINNLSLQMKPNDQNKNNLSCQMTGAAFYKNNISLEDNLQNIQVESATIDKFLNLKTFGLPINLPSESGFGRSNPFEGY